jgi:ribosomal protein S27E
VKHRSANCPACAGPVVFRVSSSFVTVCEFCNTVVARGDRQPEDHGKLADLVELRSPLMLGMTGRFRNRKFEVVGRVQYKHPTGAVWNEWYLLFGGNTWGWLGEAQSRLYLMFEKKMKTNASLPNYDGIKVGETFELLKSKYAVSEKGIAVLHSAEGEIPWAARSGSEHRYAELRGEEKSIATFEYGKETSVFVGVSVSVDELALTGRDGLAASDTIKVAALQVNCPQCAGTLSLHAPDATLRVACPNCNALLDANNGKLEYLKTLQHKQTGLVIPLGCEGTLRGDRYIVIGYMERYVVYAGKNYPWTEYLIYNPGKGFRWLVCSSGHWSFVEPIDLPIPNSLGDTLRYDGRPFKIYDRADAHVRYVLGEFPWRVTVGETVYTQDFIAPPNMLSVERSIQLNLNQSRPHEASREWSDAVASEEVNVSLGSYLPVDEVEQAFSLKGLVRPWGVGTIQPAPSPGCSLYVSYAIFVAIIIATFYLVKAIHPTSPPDGALTFIALGLVSIIPLGVQWYRHTFEVKRWAESDFSPYSHES